VQQVKVAFAADVQIGFRQEAPFGMYPRPAQTRHQRGVIQPIKALRQRLRGVWMSRVAGFMRLPSWLYL